MSMSWLLDAKHNQVQNKVINVQPDLECVMYNVQRVLLEQGTFYLCMLKLYIMYGIGLNYFSQ